MPEYRPYEWPPPEYALDELPGQTSYLDVPPLPQPIVGDEQDASISEPGNLLDPYGLEPIPEPQAPVAEPVPPRFASEAPGAIPEEYALIPEEQEPEPIVPEQISGEELASLPPEELAKLPRDALVKLPAEVLAKLPPEAFALAEQEHARLREENEATEFARAKVDQDKLVRDQYKATLDRDLRAQSDLAKLQESMEEYGNKRIEPWDPTTTQRIAGIVGAAIGGMLEVATGQRGNSTLDAIDAEINRHMSTQMADLQREGKTLSSRRSLLADQVDRNKDVMIAEQAYLAASWNRVQEKIKEDAAKFDPMGTQNFSSAKLIREVEARKNQALLEAESRIMDRADKDAKMRMEQERIDNARKAAQSSAALGWAANKRAKDALAFQERKFDTESAAKKEGAEEAAELANKQGVVVDVVTGQPIGQSRFRGKDPKHVVRAQTAVKAYSDLRTGLAEYQRKLKDVGSTYQGPLSGASWAKSQAKADLDSMYAKILLNYGRAISGATVGDEERKEHKKVIPAPEGLLQRSDAAETLNVFKESVDRDHTHYMRGELENPSDADAYMERMRSMDALEAGAPPRDSFSPVGVLTEEAMRPHPGPSELRKALGTASRVAFPAVTAVTGLSGATRTSGEKSDDIKESEANRATAVKGLLALAKSGDRNAAAQLAQVAQQAPEEFTRKLAADALKELK